MLLYLIRNILNEVKCENSVIDLTLRTIFQWTLTSCIKSSPIYQMIIALTLVPHHHTEIKLFTFPLTLSIHSSSPPWRVFFFKRVYETYYLINIYTLHKIHLISHTFLSELVLFSMFLDFASFIAFFTYMAKKRQKVSTRAGVKNQFELICSVKSYFDSTGWRAIKLKQSSTTFLFYSCMLDRSLSLDNLQKNISLYQSEISLEQTSFFLPWLKCEKYWSL